MPFTPSGRQLRSVLAGLRNITWGGYFSNPSRARNAINRTTTTKILPTTPNPPRPYKNGAIRGHNGKTALASVERSPSEGAASGTMPVDGRESKALSQTRRARKWRAKRRRVVLTEASATTLLPHAIDNDVSRRDVRAQPQSQTNPESPSEASQEDGPEAEPHAEPAHAKERRHRSQESISAVSGILRSHHDNSGQAPRKPAQFESVVTKVLPDPRCPKTAFGANRRARARRTRRHRGRRNVTSSDPKLAGNQVQLSRRRFRKPGRLSPPPQTRKSTSRQILSADSPKGWKASDVLRPRATLVDLGGILSELIQDRAAAKSGQAERNFSFRPTRWQMEVLQSTGYSNDDMEEWAKILLTPNPLDAATLLVNGTRARGLGSTPLFVLLHLLRREYISTRALRILVEHGEENFQARTRSERNMHKTVYLAFRGMLHHARKVWPAALTRITQLFLSNLAPLNFEDTLPDPDHLQHLTHTLNRALRLIVVPTAIEPIKNNIHQEAALVRVLEFMASHSPTIQIERKGYRAVVLLQLAQRKTQKEQQWAELKALSWPPWKEERTAMDSFVTTDGHGVSKAAATLLRMREAGYRPLGWERAAMIYTGWDVDRTPTIQTLTLLGASGTRFNTGTATWAGRIAATRTAQEAWAAFLAYEDELRDRRTTSPDQEVHLAVLTKLYKEDVRRRRFGVDHNNNVSTEAEKRVFKSWPLFPGDVREVWPLPPSIHLYTYTRSEPPTMNGFYEYMRQDGLVPDDYCLAFLVANAFSLKLGLQYLKDSGHGIDVTSPLIDLDQEYDIVKVPLPLFTAFVRLLCRFSKVPMSLPGQHDEGAVSQSRKQINILDSRTFTKHIAIVHAIALLQWLQPLYSPPYNAVLESLGHESTCQNLRSVESRDFIMELVNISQQSKEVQQRETSRGAVTAYRLGRRVLSLMREKHLDLDIDGLRALCQITENAAFATWDIMSDEEGQDHDALRPTPYLREAVDWACSDSHAKKLNSDFRILVGDERDLEAAHEGPAEDDDTLLEIPNFSLLHMYIRALGWMADYEGLLQTVRWMRMHATELATRQKQDRNGGVMMHRTFCALRVFLERSWLTAATQQQEQAEVEMVSSEEQSMEPRPRLRVAKQLRRLRSSAPREVVDEVRGLVESTEYWGGWPSDEDIERYYQANKRFARAV